MWWLIFCIDLSRGALSVLVGDTPGVSVRVYLGDFSTGLSRSSDVPGPP